MSKITITGFKGLEENLKKLHKAHAKNVLRKTLREAGKPVAEAAAANAPHDTGALEASITVSTKLTRSQRRLEKKLDGKHAAEMFIGAGSAKAHLVEFGTEHTAPDPFLSPAWDSMKGQVLEDIKKKSWENTIASLTKRGIAVDLPDSGDE
ncbi:HK97-gp10 family putative phage morphogenesis protein [Paracoccus sulfuroxidans]|nr:HK97-gp10 family putative phage morphogenesis protein [Paracoccus sulfuroxidans]